VKAREVAAMVATARWMYSSALERKETRGMHEYLDYPQLDPSQQHYLISGGLDKVWVKAQPLDTAGEKHCSAGVSPTEKQLLAITGKIPQSKIQNPKSKIGAVL
jgi:hypothetical protein